MPRALALEGMDVALLARDRPVLEAAALSWPRRQAGGVSGDTTIGVSVCQPVAEAVTLLSGAIDLLVNAEPARFAAPPKLGEISGDFSFTELDTKTMSYIP